MNSRVPWPEMLAGLIAVLGAIGIAVAVTGCEITGYQSGSHNTDSSNHHNVTNVYTNVMGTASTNDDVIVEEAVQ